MVSRLTENELWLLSYYRASEIGGALFFGRLACSMKPGPIQCDMTRHFSDESRHAAYWTNCIERLGAEPLRLTHTYQDQYLEAAGIPSNLMEVLALTQVFEQRVLRQYAHHARLPNVHPKIAATLACIRKDEKWHVRWVRKALRGLEEDYGRARIQTTLALFAEADRTVYARTLREHADRVAELGALPHA